MADALEEKRIASKKLAEIAKELRKTNSQLKEFDAVRYSVEKILSQLQELTEKTENKAELKEFFSKELQSQQIFELFGILQADLKQIKKIVLDFEEPVLQENVFLEGQRTYRYYSFSETMQTISFLNQLAELYSIQSFLFKPEFMGLVDFKPLEKELKLQIKDKASFIVPVSSAKRVIDFLVANKFSKNFYFSSEKIKLLFHSPTRIKAEAENSIIKRLDRLALSIEGKLLEK